MKVLVTRVIPANGIEMMQKAGLTVTEWKEKRDLTQDELIEKCKHHDALLSAGANDINKEFLQKCAHLKVVSLLSVGYDRVDVTEATRVKMPIGNTPDVLSNATADTAFLLMLATSRKAFHLHKKILRGEWGFYEPTADLGIELYGCTLGVWGLGKIGFEMARRCVHIYGMKLIYCNRNSNPRAENELGAVRVSFDELLANSDVLTIHTALTAETKGTFDKTAFSKMKKTAIFINTARGGIHNEEDLKEALVNGTIWGAGLDVTNPEPMQKDNPLLNMPNVAILPHIGSATEQTRNEMARIAAENVIAGLKGERLPHAVNPEIYE